VLREGWRYYRPEIPEYTPCFFSISGWPRPSCRAEKPKFRPSGDSDDPQHHLSSAGLLYRNVAFWGRRKLLILKNRKFHQKQVSTSPMSLIESFKLLAQAAVEAARPEIDQALAESRQEFFNQPCSSCGTRGIAGGRNFKVYCRACLDQL